MEYLPVVILMGTGLFVGLVMIALTSCLGPRRPNRRKSQPFECGVPAYSDGKQRLSVRFFLVAILFVLFDVEAVLLIPWAVVFRDFLPHGWMIAGSAALFILMIVVAFIYEWKKGGMEWE